MPGLPTHLVQELNVGTVETHRKGGMHKMKLMKDIHMGTLQRTLQDSLNVGVAVKVT